LTTYGVRLARGAIVDLEELREFLAQRDPRAADRALDEFYAALEMLKRFLFSCRKNATAHDPSLRELIVPFGRGGYVALFEIAGSETVTVLAVRHQREEDYR